MKNQKDDVLVFLERIGRADEAGGVSRQKQNEVYRRALARAHASELSSARPAPQKPERQAS